jgi:hypothetical protein
MRKGEIRLNLVKKGVFKGRNLGLSKPEIDRDIQVILMSGYHNISHQ